MALTQALSTGISGLMSHQKAMDNIGNNLANVNTVGFKKGVYQFSTLLEQALRGGMSSDAGAGRGSINPISLGLGTTTGSINKVFTQGPLENTGNPNDMAIDGNGFFVLAMENGYAYTRAGSFYRGADGSLLAGDGLYVQGTMAVKGADGGIGVPQDAKLENIVIPIGETGGQAQTSQVSFTGNLDSRQTIATGTRLFGGTSYPTVNNLQSWMWTEFNGGDPDRSGGNVDASWVALEEKTFAIGSEMYDDPVFGARLENAAFPSGVNRYGRGVVSNLDSASATAAVYYALDTATGAVVNVADPSTGFPGTPLSVQTLATDPAYATYVPLVEEIKTINGGNAQTSAAYAIEVPAPLQLDSQVVVDGRTYQVRNQQTFPAWFYESTGGDFAAAAALTDAEMSNTALAMSIIWPDGFAGVDGRQMTRMPVKGETLPASLTTPLENLMYRKGNAWVSPFANIGNGDAVEVSFRKGDARVEATFIYNRPVGPDPAAGQQNLDRELSWNLGHFLKFLGGDVDQPTLASQSITPAMFGAPVDADFPSGNPAAPGWDRAGYEAALANVAMATNAQGGDMIGGAMGLISIPPTISATNHGDDAYDAPPESAGAFSRTGVSKIMYNVWDPATNSFAAVSGDSFNASFISNLGIQNALSNIQITYNDVPHDAMFRQESDYSAPQGGASAVSVDFYDSLGNPRQATVRLAMVAQNDDFTTWRWYADCPDDTDFAWRADANGELNSNLNVGTGLIRFDKNGNFVAGSDFSETGGIVINQSGMGVNEPIVIAILNGLAGGQDLDFSSLTCSAASNSLKMKSQNGYPPGTLNDFTVSLDGTIQGIYSNGNVIDIGRIGLAMFPNENGLVAAGGNLFYAGPASGAPLYGHANTGGNGSIRHQQLESSNVDLSEEFTKLISTERGFQANSRTITTADEMITELLNLKR